MLWGDYGDAAVCEGDLGWEAGERHAWPFARKLGYSRSMGDSGKLAVDPLFEAIAAHSTDSIMLLDRDARILFINKTAPGLTVEQVLGTQVYAYVPEAQHAAMRQCFENVLLTGEPGRYENVYHLARPRLSVAHDLRFVDVELSFSVAPVAIVLEQGGRELRAA